jgi:hypothetical protein
MLVMRGDWLKGVLAAGAGFALVCLHFAVFERFFPNASGLLGHDYAYFLPHLLDGYFWGQVNGPLATPWFTPAFCGGLPKFPNPQALYYSLPQLATFLSDPLTGIRITFAVCAGLGFWGSYLLLRGSLATRRGPALLGATLFLWNSLYSARMSIGHLTFHSFMLVPLLAWFVLRPTSSKLQTRERLLIDVCGAATIIAYMATTSLAHVLLPAIVSTAAISLIRGVTISAPGVALRDLGRLASSGALAIGLSAAKLVAMYSYLDLFPRSLYPLPGIAGVGSLFATVGRLLFLPAPVSGTHAIFTNSQWRLQTHEFEYSIGFIALWILIMAAGCGLYALRSADAKLAWPTGRALALAGALALLTIPLALNYYSPGWNAFLKSIPFIGSGSTQIRWLAVYIATIVVVTALALDRTPQLRDYASLVSAVGIAATLWLGITADRTYYEDQSFDPAPVQAAHQAVEAGTWSPKIERIGVLTDSGGREIIRATRNASLARGVSELNCYETLLGFRLEHFPRGTLHAGSPLEERDGRLNLKDPSCYVFPEANGCEPGDHFTTERRAEAEAFLRYAPFDFARSGAQRAASALTAITIAGVVVSSCWAAIQMCRNTRRQQASPRDRQVNS